MSDLLESRDVNVRGLSELAKFLDELPDRLQQNVLRGSLRAGAQVVRAEVKRTAPVAPPSAQAAGKYGLYPGALRDSVRVSTFTKGGVVTASVKVGGKIKGGADVYYASWVEHGTRAHAITAKGASPAKVLKIGGGFAIQVNHPGARPRPFMRPALDTRAGAAVVAAGEYMKTRLATKHGLLTEDVEISEVLPP